MAEPGVVLDSSAVIALFLDEPGAGTVEALLRAGDVRMSSVNAAEVVDVMIRVYRADSDAAVARTEELLASTVRPVETSFDVSARAGELRARLYDGRTSRLSLADCYLLATADDESRIATTDRTLAAAARGEGIDVILLDA